MENQPWSIKLKDIMNVQWNVPKISSKSCIIDIWLVNIVTDTVDIAKKIAHMPKVLTEDIDINAKLAIHITLLINGVFAKE